MSPRRRPGSLWEGRQSAAGRLSPPGDELPLWPSSASTRSPITPRRKTDLSDACTGAASMMMEDAGRLTLSSLVSISQRAATSMAASGALRKSTAAGALRDPARLDGTWLSRADGEVRGYVEDGRLHWDEDGTATPLALHGDRGNIVSLAVDGKAYSGVLSDDERLLRWGDGDLWVRVDEFYAQLSKLSSNNLEEEGLHWGAWSRRRPSSRAGSRHGSRPWKPQLAGGMRGPVA